MHEGVVLLAFVLRRQNVVRQILSIATRDDRLRRLELELRDNVRSNVGRRCRGQCDRRRIAELLTNLRDAEIARPEVVAPLADTMRLVDCEQRYAGIAKTLRRDAGVESFGRDVE